MDIVAGHRIVPIETDKFVEQFIECSSPELVIVGDFLGGCHVFSTIHTLPALIC